MLTYVKASRYHTQRVSLVALDFELRVARQMPCEYGKRFSLGAVELQGILAEYLTCSFVLFDAAPGFSQQGQGCVPVLVRGAALYCTCGAALYCTCKYLHLSVMSHVFAHFKSPKT